MDLPALAPEVVDSTEVGLPASFGKVMVGRGSPASDASIRRRPRWTDLARFRPITLQFPTRRVAGEPRVDIHSTAVRYFWSNRSLPLR